MQHEPQGKLLGQRANGKFLCRASTRREGHLKRELVYRRCFATRQEAKTAVFAWIETGYNRKRRHSTLGYLSPEAFERQYQQQQLQPKPIVA